MYEIKLVQENDIPSLIDFFIKVYKPSHIMADKKYLMWQYLRAPGNVLYPNYPNLILKKDGEVVGHLGLIPYKFLIRGKFVKAAFLASLIVDKNLRSHGAGVMLVREAEKYFDILYTTGFSPPSAPVLEFCKWEKAVNLFRWIYDCKNAKQQVNNTKTAVINSFGDKWNEFWGEFSKSYSVTIDRSSAYLNWRFCDNPKINYNIFGLNVEGVGGYIVLRLEKGDDFTGVRIVDLIADDKTAEIFLKKAIKFASEQTADFIDFFSYPDKYKSALEKTGFYLYNPEMNQDPPIFILPTDRKKLKLNFSYKCVANRQAQIGNEDWLVVKSDGDRDRAY